MKVPSLKGGAGIRGLSGDKVERIAGLIAAGKLHKEIAHEMRLTVGTVRVYVCAIHRHLRLTGRYDLHVWWMNRELEKWLAKYGDQITFEARENLKRIVTGVAA